MRNRQRYARRTFEDWWRGIRSHPNPRRRELVTNWMKYACKTVATRGDLDQQRVVYTINTRFKNSEYDMPKYNARRVYNIVTKKQLKYKEEQEHLRRLKMLIKGEIAPGERVPVEVRTTRKTRRIVGSGHGTRT